MKIPPRADPRNTLHLFLTFNVLLFFAGVGSMFFRMARDNDDLVRTVMVIFAATACTFPVILGKLRIPVTLAVSSMAYALALFFSSFATVNAVESLKEFLKFSCYLLMFLTLASTAAAESEAGSESSRWKLALILGMLGLAIGLFHTGDKSGKFQLWSNPQVIASILSSALICTGAAFLLAKGRLKDAVFKGGALMAVVACVLGLLQFYGIDPLRPWDPRQPYNISLHQSVLGVTLPAELMNFLAAITSGRLQMGGDGLTLILPRILGIYGNPDFFAPYVLQFIPMAVAIAWLDRSRRTPAAIISVLLFTTLALTAVWGAFVSIVVLAPFFAALLGYAGGRLSRRQAVRVSVGALLAGAVMAAVLTLTLHFTRLKRPAIEERLVKWRLAEEMWERQPLNGVGLNAYKSWYPLLQQEVRLQHNIRFEMLGSSFTQENRTHNDFAQMLAETGVAGTGTFIWLMVVILAGGLGRLRKAGEMSPAERANLCGLVGGVLVILIYAIPNFPFHIVSSGGTFWIMAGLLASYGIKAESPAGAGTDSAPLRPAIVKGLIACAAATVFLMGLYGYHIFRGTLEYKRGDFYSRLANPVDVGKASHHYSLALLFDTSNAQYAYDYGALCFNYLPKTPALASKAESLLKRSLNQGFVNEDLAYGLGHLADKKGETQEALKWYTLALALNERHQYSRDRRLAIMLGGLADGEKAFSKGQHEKARKLYLEALRKDPGNFLAAFKYGTLSVTPFGDRETGMTYLKAAAGLAVNEPMIYLALGRVYAASRLFEKAREAFLKADMLAPETPEIQNTLKQIRIMMDSATLQADSHR